MRGPSLEWLCLVLVSASAWGFAPPEEGTCLRCHGNQPAPAPSAAPLLDEQFSMEWKMWEFPSKSRPPIDKFPAGAKRLRGTTHYDWKKKSMTEVYRDQCIDIFPAGRDFPCQFLSVGSETHLIRYADTTLKKIDSCCRWSEGEFWAPRPDVIRNMKAETQPGSPRAWWLLDIPLPGPFGFGFAKKSEPGAFWFPVIAGWVQQEFHDYKTGAPEASVFRLPTECKSAPVCD